MPAGSRPASPLQQAIEQARLRGERAARRRPNRCRVHATARAHVDPVKAWPDDKVRDAVNAHLQMAGARIAVLKAAAVPDGFDARFRRPAATILPHRQPPRQRRSTGAKSGGCPSVSDVAPCARRQKCCSGGMISLPSVRPNAADSPVRTLDRLDVSRVDDLIEVRASARSFLHNQVRSMVGSLKRVGEGGWTIAELKAALDARDRAACGQVAPPDGLFLVHVDYPEMS
jgi:tRNA pseudouridine38-40 synthase